MADFNTTLSDFIINKEDPNGFDTFNRIVGNLIRNDLIVYGSFGNIPGVWFCKWYNDSRVSGYNTGDFFWLNTQDISKWMKDNSDEMREITDKNPYVTIKLPEWKSNDEEVYDMYYNVLTGYWDEKMSAPMSALYYLGELSDRFQIVVSQKDDNKDAIDVLSSWKRFAVNSDEDYENILAMIDKQIISSLNRHIAEYHFGNDILTEKIMNSLSEYMDEDFHNANYAYPINFIVNDGECEGLDSIVSYVRKPFNPRGGDTDIQEYVWFRKWRSGFLEHGGVINVTLSDYLVSGSYVQIPFGWKLLDEGSKAYRVSYIGNDEGSAVEVDETHETPPGDNLVSVVYELSTLEIDNSEYAPTYSNANYIVNICPVQPDGAYANLGRYAKTVNTLEYAIDYDNLSSTAFRFKYDSLNTPKYYCYYAAGFRRDELKKEHYNG